MRFSTRLMQSLMRRYHRTRQGTALNHRLFVALNYLANRDAYRTAWREGITVAQAHRKIEKGC